MTKISLPLLLSALGALPAHCAAPVENAGMEKFAIGGYFECLLPAGWSRNVNDENPDKVFGVEVFQTTGPVQAVISVDYYAPGNAMYRSAVSFIRANSKEDKTLKVEGEKYGPVVPWRSGDPGKMFDRRTFDFVPPDSAKPEKVAMIERHVVRESKKGFYVLRCRFPEKIFKEYLPMFNKVAGSLRTLK